MTMLTINLPVGQITVIRSNYAEALTYLEKLKASGFKVVSYVVEKI